MTVDRPTAIGSWRWLVVCLLSVSHFAVAQENPVPLNHEVVNELIQLEVIPLVDNALKQKTVVISKPSPTTPLSQWLKTKITEACLGKEFVVYSEPDSADSVSLLRFVQPVLQIEYQTAGRNWFFRSKEYKRRLLLKMQLEVIAPDGRVVLSSPVDAAFEDRVSRNELERLQNAPQSFLRGTKNDSGLIKRWLEPVATTVATATVIYLFYSLRSD